jgi:hypothetical protein
MDLDPALSTMFPTLAAARHPGYDEMLTALEREFRAVDGARLADVLDDAARPILGAASLPPRRRALALAEAAWSALPATATEPPAWMVSEALRTGAAAPPLRAAVAAELGRRAGVAARPVRLRGRWLVAVHEPGLSPVGADSGADDDLAPEGVDGCLCPHELAFVILGRLAHAWLDAGSPARAHRAAGLRLLLPLGARLQAKAREDLIRYGGTG